MALPQKFTNLRGELLAGIDRNAKKPLEETWYTNNLKALLEAHYEVFKDVSFNDVECMLETCLTRP